MHPSTLRRAWVACAAALAFCGAGACETGVYRDAFGESAILTQRIVAGAAPELRYTLLDGRRGSVAAADALVRCTPEGVRSRLHGAAGLPMSRVVLTETPTHFKNLGAEFSGLLIEPPDGGAQKPLLAFVGGSEQTTPVGTAYPYLFAAQGISVFIYDKRGTGTSGGFYTQNFDLLGSDAAAALREARRMAAGRYGRAGYFGGSQGGWVAPLAAKLGGADFVAVGFGLVLSPLEEDREQVLFEMRRKGYDEAAVVAAGKVADAAGAVVASHFTGGYDELEQVKRRYAAAPWLTQIEGEFTGEVLAADPAELRRTGQARLDSLGITWNYDAAAVIGSLATPQLWVLADSDRDAPSDLTRARLETLIRSGRPIELFVFPNTDHGITEFTEAADGTRTTTRVADGYYRMLGDWIRGRWAPPYGNAVRVR
jgi:hypothetical protein